MAVVDQGCGGRPGGGGGCPAPPGGGVDGGGGEDGGGGGGGMPMARVCQIVGGPGPNPDRLSGTDGRGGREPDATTSGR